MGGGGWIRLIVGFQPLMVISPTASCIRWRMQGYACELMWTCLVGPNDLRPRQFLGAKPPIQFRHRWAERNHSDHLYWLRAAQSVLTEWETHWLTYWVTNWLSGLHGWLLTAVLAYLFTLLLTCFLPSVFIYLLIYLYLYLRLDVPTSEKE